MRAVFGFFVANIPVNMGCWFSPRTGGNWAAYVSVTGVGAEFGDTQGLALLMGL